MIPQRCRSTNWRARGFALDSRHIGLSFFRYYNKVMPTWDERKRLGNLERHGIDFAQAEEIWDRPTVTREDIRHDYGEPRYVTFGVLAGRVVVLVHTERGDDVHIISLRRKRATTLKPRGKSPARIDPDSPPWSEDMLGPALVRRGRGKQVAPIKVSTTIRLDADVLAYFRSTGTGYQTRINDALRAAISRQLKGRTGKGGDAKRGL
jgi:uncharacterized DUF497 family protein